jgi:hypothetical protein
MKPRVKSVVVIVCVFFVGTVLGFFGGVYAEREMATTKAKFTKLGAEMGAAEHDAALLELVLDAGDDASRVAVLRAHLERVRKSDPATMPLTGDVLPYEEVLTLARLSYVSSRMGKESEARDYMRQSEEKCATVGWKKCDAATLSDIGQRLTQRPWERAPQGKDHP